MKRCRCLSKNAKYLWCRFVSYLNSMSALASEPVPWQSCARDVIGSCQTWICYVDSSTYIGQVNYVYPATLIAKQSSPLATGGSKLISPFYIPIYLARLTA
jgi:hypothetical protein